MWSGVGKQDTGQWLYEFEGRERGWCVREWEGERPRAAAAPRHCRGPARDTLRNPLQLDDGIDESLLVAVLVRRPPAPLLLADAEALLGSLSQLPLTAAERVDRPALGLQTNVAKEGRTPSPGRGQAGKELLTLPPRPSSVSSVDADS